MKPLNVIFGSLFIFFGSISVVVAQESPLTVDGATSIDAHQAKELYDQSVYFIDVRTQDLWETGRIPGAIFLEFFSEFEEENLVQIADKSDKLVIYCAGPSCKRSSKACAKAVSWGYTSVYYFRGGFPAWQEAGYPTDPP